MVPVFQLGGSAPSGSCERYYRPGGITGGQTGTTGFSEPMYHVSLLPTYMKHIPLILCTFFSSLLGFLCALCVCLQVALALVLLRSLRTPRRGPVGANHRMTVMILARLCSLPRPLAGRILLLPSNVLQCPCINGRCRIGKSFISRIHTLLHRIPVGTTLSFGMSYI